MLYARHYRDGKAISYDWDWKHLASIYEVTETQGLREQLRHEGTVTIKELATTEVMRFEPGDVVELWR